MRFEGRELSLVGGDRTKVIAEIGVNHDGSIDKALDMINTIKSCGGDVVKLQAFIASEEISVFADKVDYQVSNTGSGGNQLEMAQALELSHSDLKKAREHCLSIDMPFLCTAFENKSLEFLVSDLEVKSLKIASSEVTHAIPCRYF